MKLYPRRRALGAESRDDLRRLADEQAALRRVATLVARAAPPEDLFAAVTKELGQLFPVGLTFIYRYDPENTATLLGGWSTTTDVFPLGDRWPLEGKNLVTMVAQTGRPARIDSYVDASGPLSAEARKAGLQSGVGVPIIVDGQLWGTMSAATWSEEPLPRNLEVQIGSFTELLATAIANAQSRANLTRLADEQVALRRVATVIATGATAAEVFASVAKEAAGTLEVPLTTVIRFESNGTATLVGSWGVENPFTIGTSWRLDDKSVSSLVASTGQPARVDDYSVIPGPLSDTLGRDPGIRTGVGVPVLVDGRPWGVMMALSTDPEPFPADTEDRLAAFTGLVATAIANTESRSALHRLADEQVALRRVATLVAEGAPAAELFDVVAREVMQVLDVPAVLLHRYRPPSAFTVVAARARDGAAIFPVGSTFPLDGPSVSAKVFETGRPARVDDYAGAEGTVAAVVRSTDIRSSIGVPITVDGALWGAMVVGTTDEPVPADTEDRLREFTELIATAVSSANAREGLRRLAEEQAALRRVATLVAEAPASTELFAAVTEEAARLLDVPVVSMARFEQDGTATVIAALPGAPIPAGTQLALDGPSVIASILETGLPARIDDYTGLPGEIAARQREGGTLSGFGSPIVVDGGVWGAMAAAVSDQSRVPAGAEARLLEFTELVATAISNAATRAQLIASRARIVEAGDEARRRIERNLHDGTQQRLIALGLDLQRIRATIPEDQRAAHGGLERAERDLESVLEDVRELSRGLHPALLLRGGLRPALRALARRSPIPVKVEIDLVERPSSSVEAAVYYIISEALTNAIKHSQASAISVTIATDHVRLRVLGLDGRRGLLRLHAKIADDGVGGAEPTQGSGLMGAIDRVDALGGRLTLASKPGHGTTISIALPIVTPDET